LPVRAQTPTVTNKDLLGIILGGLALLMFVTGIVLAV
jgi:hypothetical protein